MNTIDTESAWQIAFAEWKRISKEAGERGRTLDQSLHEQGRKLALSVGVDPCCVHNASIDDEMTGWCKGNPLRLAAVKRANYLMNQWPGSDQARKLSAAAWNRLMVPVGACVDPSAELPTGKEQTV